MSKAIVRHLTEKGWHAGNAKAVNSELASDTAAVRTLPSARSLTNGKAFVNSRHKVKGRFIQWLVKEPDLRGMLDVLLPGIEDNVIAFQLARWKPEYARNEDALKLSRKTSSPSPARLSSSLMTPEHQPAERLVPCHGGI